MLFDVCMFIYNFDDFFFILAVIFAKPGVCVPPSWDMKKLLINATFEEFGEEYSKSLYGLLDIFERANLGLTGGMGFVTFVFESFYRIRAIENGNVEERARATGKANFLILILYVGFVGVSGSIWYKLYYYNYRSDVS